MKVPYHTHPLPRHRHVHRHKLLMPSGRELYTEQDEPFPGHDFINFDDTMESGIWNDSEWEDEELGWVPQAIMGGLAGISALGQLFGGGDDDKKGGGGTKSPLEMIGGEVKAARGILETLGIVDPQKQQEVISAMVPGGAPSQPQIIQTGPQLPPGASPQELQYIVKDLLSNISPPVRQKVREVISEMKGSDASEENLVANIEQRVGSNVMPELKKALQALKLAQTQNEATSEHRALVKEADRWRENLANQQQLMNRIVAMEAKLTNAMKKKRR